MKLHAYEYDWDSCLIGTMVHNYTYFQGRKIVSYVRRIISIIAAQATKMSSLATFMLIGMFVTRQPRVKKSTFTMQNSNMKTDDHASPFVRVRIRNKFWIILVSVFLFAGYFKITLWRRSSMIVNFVKQDYSKFSRLLIINKLALGISKK